MTSQKKYPSSQEDEKSDYPAKTLTNLTVEDLKNYLIKKWSKDDFKSTNPVISVKRALFSSDMEKFKRSSDLVCSSLFKLLQS